MQNNTQTQKVRLTQQTALVFSRGVAGGWLTLARVEGGVCVSHATYDGPERRLVAWNNPANDTQFVGMTMAELRAAGFTAGGSNAANQEVYRDAAGNEYEHFYEEDVYARMTDDDEWIEFPAAQVDIERVN